MPGRWALVTAAGTWSQTARLKFFETWPKLNLKMVGKRTNVLYEAAVSLMRSLLYRRRGGLAARYTGRIMRPSIAGVFFFGGGPLDLTASAAGQTVGTGRKKQPNCATERLSSN